MSKKRSKPNGGQPRAEDPGVPDWVAKQLEEPDHGPKVFAPSATLATQVLRRALPERLVAALRRDDPVVLLLETPGEAWIQAVKEAVGVLFDGGTAMILPAKSLRAAEASDIRTIRGRTVAIAADLALLPSEIVAAADMRIRLSLTPADVQATLKTLYGRSAKVRHADLAGLDWRQVVVAFRPGSTPRACVERLRQTSAKLRAAQLTNATPLLDDLPAHAAALRELKSVAADVIRLREHRSTGERVPSVLLYGPPGTGKTTLARSLARTVDLPLLPTSVGEWFTQGDSHLGAVINAARRFFEQAAASAPCVALIDEIDALPDRATMDERGRDWWTPLVTTVLIGIDRMRDRDGQVVLVGATNHVGRLDAALLRPGRFDLHVEVLGPGTAAEVEKIMRFHLRGELADRDLRLLAETALALGLTGAAIETAVRAAHDRARSLSRDMTLRDLVDLVAPPDPRDRASRLRTAIHEAGHAILAHAIGLVVERVSIVRNGAALGMTTYRDEGFLVSDRGKLEAHVVTTLAGRAADEVVSGVSTAGAMMDLRIATRLVAAIHGCFGLGETLVSRGHLDDAEALIVGDRDLRRLVAAELDRLMERARDLARRHAPAIRALAEELVERRVVGASDVAEAFDRGLRDRSMNEMSNSRMASRAPDRPPATPDPG